MNITRRAALGGIAAISATGGAGASPLDPSLSQIDALISCYVAAEEASDTAWEAVPRIQRPIVRVLIGRILSGQDAETFRDIYRLIFAYDEADIDRHGAKNMRAMIAIHGKSPDQVDKIRRQYAEWAAGKKAELASRQAAAKLYEDETGYTAAVAAARRAAEALEAVRTEIVGFVPRSLPAAAKKAAWCVDRLDDPDMAEMVRMLRSFAGASDFIS